jgi:valyl-tRNA synthetase
METIHAIRSLKKEQNVQRECPALFVDCKADDEGITAAQLFRQHAADLAFICKAPVVNVVNGSTDPDLFATRSVSGSISVALRLDQLAVAPIHDSTNRSRVEKKLAKLNELHFRLESEINHPQTPLNVKEIKR